MLSTVLKLYCFPSALKRYTTHVVLCFNVNTLGSFCAKLVLINLIFISNVIDGMLLNLKLMYEINKQIKSKINK